MSDRSRGLDAEVHIPHQAVFVDTSAFYAALDRQDRCHQRAKDLLSAEDRLITTDHVLVETWRLARDRAFEILR